MAELLTSEKILEIITTFELDRNFILKDIVNNGDTDGSKDRKVRMLEGLSRSMVIYKQLAIVPVEEPVV